MAAAAPRGRTPARPDAAVRCAASSTRSCVSAGVTRRITLSCSRGLAVPRAIGAREICVPVRALRDLTPAEQRALLAHETAHLLRRDGAWLFAAAAAADRRLVAAADAARRGAAAAVDGVVLRRLGRVAAARSDGARGVPGEGRGVGRRLPRGLPLAAFAGTRLDAARARRAPDRRPIRSSAAAAQAVARGGRRWSSCSRWRPASRWRKPPMPALVVPALLARRSPSVAEALVLRFASRNRRRRAPARSAAVAPSAARRLRLAASGRASRRLRPSSEPVRPPRGAPRLVADHHDGRAAGPAVAPRLRHRRARAARVMPSPSARGRSRTIVGKDGLRAPRRHVARVPAPESSVRSPQPELPADGRSSGLNAGAI